MVITPPSPRCMTDKQHHLPLPHIPPLPQQSQIIQETQELGISQSASNLKHTFTITVPIPVIARRELRCVKDPVALYLHLLHLFASSDLGLLDNDFACTNVIAHNLAFIERHWKKFTKVSR